MVRPRIGIDARLFGIRDRGLGRYTAELVESLCLLRNNFNFTLFVREDSEARVYERQGFQVVTAPYAPYSFSEQWHFPKLIKKQGVDLMHFPHLNVPLFMNVPTIVTIHDLILHHFPSRYGSILPPPLYWLKYAAYRMVVRRAVARARSIVAVSSFTAEDIETYYPSSRHKLRVVPESVTLEGKDLRNDSFSDVLYNSFTPYALVVGAFYPHKNLERLVRVWKSASAGLNLVLIGRVDAFGERLRKQVDMLGILDQKAGGVHFLGEVSDRELTEAYRHARLVIFPSLLEGYGLPGLEALSLGMPVLTSAHGSLPEIYGSRVLYLPVETDQEMSAGLGRVLPLISSPLRLAPSKAQISREEIAETFRQIYTQHTIVSN